MDSSILKKIKESRPNLKKSSMLSYERNMKKIFKLLYPKDEEKKSKQDINDIKWILKIDDIIKSLSTTPNASKRAYFATLLVFLYCFFPDNKEEHQKITNEINKIKDVMKATAREQKMSPTEKANWMSWEDIQTFFKVYHKRCKYLLKKKHINTQEKECLQRLLLLAIYTQHPPRRPFAYENMRMETDKTYKKLKEEIGDDITKFNYLICGKKTCFIFNNYKTNHAYGQQVIQVKPKSPLTRILRSYCKLFPNTDYLFSHINDKTKSLNADAIGKKLKKIFVCEFKKDIGSTMLRHIYISHMYSNPQMTLADKDKIALQMGHSQGTASEVYHKIKNPGF